jgi:hypothetical protein
MRPATSANDGDDGDDDDDWPQVSAVGRPGVGKA